MKILGIDLETTGLDLGACKILEIACAVWDTDCNRIMHSFSTVINCDTHPILAEISKIHGLTNGNLKNNGVPLRPALEVVADFCTKVDAICAHNAINFDRVILERDFEANGINIPQKTWIDTQTDVDYPNSMSSRRLTHLAVDHGFLNMFPHQAMFDVATMLRILSSYDIGTVVSRAQSPLIVIRAVAPREKNDEIRRRRYRWNPVKMIWHKTIRQFDLEKEIKEAPFTVEYAK